MPEQYIPWAAWAGLVLVALLCLPIRGLQKMVLFLSTWLLRLTVLAVLAGGAYLFFRPGDLPTVVANVLDDFPAVLQVLPERGTPSFGLCLALLIAGPLVPVLANLGVTAALAGRRLGRLQVIADGRPVVVAASTPPRAPAHELAVEDPGAAEPVPVAEPVLRPINRRTASTTLASAPNHIPVAPIRR